jgi:LacI family transcriptional regulator
VPDRADRSSVSSGSSRNRGPVRQPSVKDVAKLAGVSLGTVSNVMNKPDKVAPATRARVDQAMTQLGFVRNEQARQLRGGGSRTLAYVMLDVTNPFFTDVAQGVEQVAEEVRMTVFMCNSDNRAARELDYLSRLQEQRVQGILITPLDPDSPALAATARLGTPVVLVDRTAQRDDLCSVAVDDQLGGRLAIAHLLDQGHRRIGFVGGPRTFGQVRDRLDGARRAMAAGKRKASDLIVLETAALSVDEGRAAGERLAGMTSELRPTAAFCANDLLALGLLQQCVSLGVRVPDELAIIGYDDIDFAAAAAVPLSSVRQPRRELGRAAAELVLDEAQNANHQHQQIVFTPELIARASSASRRPASRDLARRRATPA